LGQSRRDDWKGFAVERVDRRDQSEDETNRGKYDLSADSLLTYRTVERVRDDFDRGLQCFEPPLAIAGMSPDAILRVDTLVFSR
jgi:hypothetical protein